MVSILLVEDDQEINNMLVEFLSQHEFKVTPAYSGTEGRLWIKSEAFDLVLLDLMLPGLSGEELLVEIRKISQVPVIVLSAKGQIESKVQVLRMGADDYMVKPFNLQELLARIQVCLKRNQIQAQTINQPIVYQLGGLSYNEETQVIAFQGQEIHLTAQERLILALLLKQPKKIFTKRELIELAWQDYYEGDDKTLNVHISNIRKKLTKVSQEDWIETVWGIGYRLKKQS